MKKYFLLLFAVLLLSACNKNLQLTKIKSPVYTTKQPTMPLLALQPKKVVAPVVLQPLPTAKMVLSSQNIYEQAYYQIRQMLQGGKPLSFKKAVYLTENAYFDNELPENSFNQAITDLVSLTKAVDKTSKFSHKYADSTNLWKNFAIYRTLADTLNVANIFQLLPYEYDFEDSRGEKEWAKGFVTKLLATRTGNCHSLPFLYKILAEELETEAYLSLLPHHIYLQIPHKRPPYGVSHYFNTELTSKTFPLDAWVMAAGYVTIPAIQTKMYMDRLDTKQSIALCLVDLAKGFEARNKDKLSAAEIDKFMQNCVNLALQTAPNLITARLLQVELDKRNFVITHNKLIYKQLEINITKLFADGYLELPELMYSEHLKTAGLDSTYTPFAQENIREGTPTGKGTVLTLSNGRYAEFKNAKRIETIGSVRFNTEKKKIVGFGENKREVEVVSRFLSVDPLARQYPWFSPYQFAGNMPIAAIDLDGLEIFFSTTPIIFSSAAATTTTATTVARMGMRATDLATSSGSGSTASPIVRPAPGQILPPPLPPVVPETGVNQPGSTAGQKSQEQVKNELFDSLWKKSSAKQDATQVTRNTPLAQQKEKEGKEDDNAYFRGTTMGFGDNLPSDAYTSTSTDPLIATLFGLAAEGKRHEAGVLHISFESDVMGLGRDQNWLAGKEAEVAFMVHPLSFERNNTSLTISIDRARGILQSMGFSLPSSKSLANPSRLDQEISEQPKMSKYQIEEFINRAKQ